MRKCYLLLICALLIISAQQKTASQEVYKVAPTMYKVLSDTLGIRVMEAAYKPGESSAMHVHPDFALYILEGGKIEITNKEGAKQLVDFKTGMGIVLPTDTHTARNVGTTTVRLVVVEVNRARQ
jgi:quercetin dioxygenase-like cupin family protein